MANVDGPRGFSLASQMGTGNPAGHLYETANDVATPIGIGDLVKKVTGASTYGYSRVEVMAAASDDYVGVVLGVYDVNKKPLKYLPASTAGLILVCDDPQALFIVQTDNNGTALTSAACGDQANAIWSSTVNTDTGRAGVQLSETLAGDGNYAQFRIIEKVDVVDNEWGEHYIKLIVQASKHAYLSFPAAI